MALGSNVDEWDKQHTSLHLVKGCNEKWARLCSCACLPLWNSGSLMSLPVSALMSFVKDNYGLLDERVSLCDPLVDGAFLTFLVHFWWPVPDAEFKSGGHRNNGALVVLCSASNTYPLSAHLRTCPTLQAPMWLKRKRTNEKDWEWGRTKWGRKGFGAKRHIWRSIARCVVDWFLCFPFIKNFFDVFRPKKKHFKSMLIQD